MTRLYWVAVVCIAAAVIAIYLNRPVPQPHQWGGAIWGSHSFVEHPPKEKN